MKKLDTVALALVIVGAVNWGLVALAEFDLVATIFGMEFGETNALTRIVYGLVASRADAALIPEPEDEKLVRANVGVLWFQIEMRGYPVHVRFDSATSPTAAERFTYPAAAEAMDEVVATAIGTPAGV